MSTQKQIQSNRQNAQLSTGPRTAEGKAISRMNALKTGIDAVAETACGEDPAALAALAAHYDREFQPIGVVERLLVDLLVNKDWLLRRYRFLSADLTNHSSSQPFANRQGNEFGAGFAASLNAIHRLHRHTVDTERAYFRHLAELEGRQAIRRQREAEAEPPVTECPATENPATGFVPQTTGFPAVTPHLEPRPKSTEPLLGGGSVGNRLAGVT